ncbi:DNA primase [Candidatus Dependentiae bacterium]|nr:DNA primase [Candidatus Dependentiae bacterium]
MDLFNYLKNALPILDVVHDFVQLRPAGHYWKGSCPFHSETDASFTVSPDRQIFYCFGCHASGDVIAFIAKRENVSQIEAAKFIIDHYNISVPPEVLKGASKALLGEQGDERNRYYQVCEKFAHWCHQALLRSPAALAYSQQRNLNSDTIRQFSIGYFPGGLQATQQLVNAMANEGILAKDLITFGIIGEKKNYFYSPFEERIIFPIKDQVGRICAFGGRIFKPGDERAKYYNSKESDWFIKGKVLYGLDSARKAMQDTKQAFLVEGYMDCVMMVQYGFANTAATLGTACTSEHLKLISRFADTLYVLYDGDNAGQNAILRMTQLCWEVNLDLMVVPLPYKEDPASFLNKGGDLRSLIARAQDIIHFFVATYVKDFRSKPLAGKLAAIHKIFEVIVNLKDPLKRDLLLQQTALAIDLPFQSVKDGLIYYGRNQALRRGGDKDVELGHSDLAKEDIEVLDTSELEQKILYGILTNLQEPQVFIEAELSSYFSPQVQSILTKISSQESGVGGKLHESSLQALLNDSEKVFVSKVLMSFDTPVTPSAFSQLKTFFCKYHWKRIARDFKDQIQQAQQAGSNDRMQSLIRTFSQLKQGFADKGLL